MRLTLTVCLLLALTLRGFAADDAHIRVETQRSQTSNGKPAAALLVNGTVVARIAKPQDGHSPVRSIGNAATRVAAAYRSGRYDVQAQPLAQRQREWALLLNGRALLLATDSEAKAWGMVPESLAKSWQHNLLSALQDSPPATGPRTAAGRDKPTPATADQSRPPASPAGAKPPVQAQSAGAQGQASMPALPLGTGTVQQGGGANPDYAGLVIAGGQHAADPPSATMLDHRPLLPSGAIVTGSRPGPDIIGVAVDAALRLAQHVPAGAPLLWKLGGENPVPLAPKPGEVREVPIDYTAAGAPASTTLTVQNRSLATPRETLTLFSNSPESVYHPQLLYEAELPAGRAARLVYHHQNQTRSGLRFVIRALASGPASALHVIPGTAPPDLNTFYVGFRSAENYWTNLNAGNGYAAPVAAEGQLILLSQDLAYGYTASGYMKLTNLGEAALRIEVLALPAGARPPDGVADAVASTTHCVFDAPYLSEEDVYETGDPWLYLRLGEGRPESNTDSTVLHGCYGMTHSYNVELRNTSGAPALLFILLRASAGEVKGQFYINDQYIATPLVGGGDEQLLQEIPLPAGQTKVLHIKALALNGGFYPASIVIRETRNP